MHLRLSLRLPGAPTGAEGSGTERSWAPASRDTSRTAPEDPAGSRILGGPTVSDVCDVYGQTRLTSVLSS